MRLKKIQENKINFWIYPGRIYDQPVFYNPEAELNRDLTISAIQTYQKNSKSKLNICDALAATGISGLRYAKEITGVKKVTLIDKNPKAAKLIQKNIKENKLSRKCKVLKADANVVLHQNVFPVIDIDPFGSPNLFMDSLARSIWHKGFVCITATDTAPLAGRYPKACLKKYGLVSLKTPYYNELGIRILISYIILALAKRDRVFVPQLCFATKHYFRVFGEIEHLGKMESILKKFDYLSDCTCGNFEVGLKEKCFCGKIFRNVGPIYLGRIFDRKFCREVLKDLKKRKFRLQKKEEKLLNLIIGEADMPAFYYDLHYLGKVTKKKLPRIDDFIKKLRKKGFKASRTHFSLTSVKTTAEFRELKKLI